MHCGQSDVRVDLGGIIVLQLSRRLWTDDVPSQGQLYVYFYGRPADLPRSLDDLQALVRHGLGGQVGILRCDRSGFCLWGKPPKPDRFISDWCTAHGRAMDWTVLKLLLGGPSRIADASEFN